MSMIDRWSPFRLSPTWDPFREIDEMRNQFTRLLGNRLPLRKNGGSEELELTDWLPPVDITEDSKEYTIKAELPGLTKENVKVTVEGGVLEITGERKEEKEEKDKKHHRIESSYGSFRRSFTLPEDASGEKVTADFKDGVLEVHLPKDQTAKAPARPRFRRDELLLVRDQNPWRSKLVNNAGDLASQSPIHS